MIKTVFRRWRVAVWLRICEEVACNLEAVGHIGRMFAHTRISMSALLAGAVGILVSITVALVVLLSAYANLRNTIDLVFSVSEQTMERLEHDIRAHLSPAAALVDQLANRVERGRLDPSDDEAIARFASGGFASAPQIAGLLVWDKNLNEIEVLRTDRRSINLKVGTVENAEAIHELSREIFLAGKARWGAPFRTRGVTYINILAPLIHKGKFAGMAVSGVTISKMSALLKRDTNKYDVTPFILYDGNQVLAHPSFAESDEQTGIQTKDAGLIPLANFPDPILSKFNKSVVDEEFSQATFKVRQLDLEDDTYFFLTRQLTGFSDKPWTIGIYLKEGRFDEQFERLVESILVGLGLLALSIFLIWFMARRISAPIEQISRAAQQVSALDLAQVPRLTQSRVKELHKQAVAFNKMTGALKLFETYVPRQLVKRLLRDPNASAPPPHLETLTVMFIDVIGFTARTESMSPEDVAKMLNAYFTVVNRCINAEDGTVDKYIGDAVMAFWGAPETQDDHAARACRAALAIAKACETDPNFPDIRLKVAIHTGPLLVGDIGAPGRINFTVIGDTVNTCARIESLGSQVDDGARAVVMASRETVDAAGEDFEVKKLGKFSVKGRARKVEVLRLIGTS